MDLSLSIKPDEKKERKVSNFNLASSLIDPFVDLLCRSIQRDRFKNLAQKLLISSSAVGVFHASAPGSPVSAAAVLAKHPVPELSLAATTVSLINSCLRMSDPHFRFNRRTTSQEHTTAMVSVHASGVGSRPRLE